MSADLTSLLRRDLAPIGAGVWESLDEEARQALEHFLSARRLVPVRHVDATTAAIPTGRLHPVVADDAAAFRIERRGSIPVLDLAVDFGLDLAELEAAARGATDPDLGPLTDAARDLAFAEDRLVYDGVPEVGIGGLLGGTPHPPIRIGDDYDRYPNHVAQAVHVLRQAGVDGPYGLALGPRCYRGVIETTERGGYPVFEHLRSIIGGPIVWSPNIDGAALVSMRGGDQELVVAVDHALGYRSHDDSRVRFRLHVAVTFRHNTPEATVRLRYGDRE